jgi:hypothetical protein
LDKPRGSSLNPLDARVVELEAAYPRWMVWYVPLSAGGQKWCARPKDGGIADTIYACNSTELAEYIQEIEAGRSEPL